MKLICKGKILKDEMTLEDYGITEGVKVNMMKGKPAADVA